MVVFLISQRTPLGSHGFYFHSEQSSNKDSAFL